MSAASSQASNPFADGNGAIRHVTIRQLRSAQLLHQSAKRYHIDGIELEKFIIVANIINRSEITRTPFTYHLDDGTGTIHGRTWEKEQMVISSRTSLDLPYVRVVGRLDKRNSQLVAIDILSIQQVHDVYAPYYHILQTIAETVAHQRGPPVSYPLSSRDTTTKGSYEPGGFFRHAAQTNLLSQWPTEAPSMLDGDFSMLNTPPRSSRRQEESPQAIDLGHKPLSLYEVENALPPLPVSYNSKAVPNRDRGFPSDEPPIQTPTKPVRKWIRGGPQPPKGKSRENNAAFMGSPVSVSGSVNVNTRHGKLFKFDPLSRLKPLEREIILCIQNDSTMHSSWPSLYPEIDNVHVMTVAEDNSQSRTWKGVSISNIVSRLTLKWPTLTPEEVDDAVKALVDGGHIFNPVDLEHYCCT